MAIRWTSPYCPCHGSRFQLDGTVAAVGACLTRHEGDSRIMREAVADRDATLKRVSAKCLVPRCE